MPLPESGAVAAVVGATGLIGSHLVRQLLLSGKYARVVVFARGAIPPDLASAENLDWRQTDPLDPELVTWPEYQVDVLFCALGTTRGVSGVTGQTWIDRDMVVGFVQRAVVAGVSLVSVVSALGADAQSRVFYSRLKGQMEDAVVKAGAETVHLWRPSVLEGDRELKRPGEQFWGWLLGLLPLSKISPRAGSDVAAAMIAATSAATPGVFRYYVPDIEVFNRKTH